MVAALVPAGAKLGATAAAPTAGYMRSYRDLYLKSFNNEIKTIARNGPYYWNPGLEICIEYQARMMEMVVGGEI